jgi:D-aminoacyl-tRNA deacylase
MKPLVVISSGNEASRNIRGSLLKLETPEQELDAFWSFADFDMAEYAGSIVEIVPTHDAEYYVFASTHRSKSNIPTFTAHTPGNWGSADLGGKPRTLNVAFGSKVKAAAQKMAELNAGTLDWKVEVEADHHGPSLSKPVLFVEIGSTEAEWKNEVAGEIAAKAILAAIRSEARFPAYVGFGGTHYAPKFTPMVIGGDAAFGHIISGYAIERDGIDAEMVRQAVERNMEKPECAFLDWKGIKGEPRKKLVETLDSLGYNWERA